MIRHLLLTGGPGHDFVGAASALMGLFAEVGADTEVVTEPGHAIDALRSAADGSAPAIDLLTVHALRWRMEQDRYAAQRAEHAVALGSDDLAVLDGFVRDGGGLLALHTAVICFDADPVWHALCGASWSWEASSHPPVGPLEVAVTATGRTHELTAGIDDFEVEDEAYGFLDEEPGIEPLLTATHGGRVHPLLWARPVGAGRVVTDLLGHGPASLTHPAHRTILARAATWAAGRRPGRTDAPPTPERSPA